MLAVGVDAGARPPRDCREMRAGGRCQLTRRGYSPRSSGGGAGVPAIKVALTNDRALDSPPLFIERERERERGCP
jgi:hypothetical protein